MRSMRPRMVEHRVQREAELLLHAALPTEIHAPIVQERLEVSQQLQAHGFGAVTLRNARAPAFFRENVIEYGPRQQRHSRGFRQCTMQNAALQQHVQTISRRRRTQAQPQ